MAQQVGVAGLAHEPPRTQREHRLQVTAVERELLGAHEPGRRASGLGALEVFGDRQGVRLADAHEPLSSEAMADDAVGVGEHRVRGLGAADRGGSGTGASRGSAPPTTS